MMGGCSDQRVKGRLPGRVGRASLLGFHHDLSILPR
jgi:hypothetical protein